MKIGKKEEDQFYMETNKLSELIAQQEEMEAGTSWESEVSGFTVHPLLDAMTAWAMSRDPGNSISLETLQDTVANAGLMLEYGGKTACLRSCAMSSLLETAGISGGGISRVGKEALAIGLTAFLSGSRSSSRVMTRLGKVAAIVSSGYEYMPITSLLQIMQKLENTCGKAEFVDGAISHDRTIATFRYPGVSDHFTDVYNRVATAHGYPATKRITPYVQFISSDTSNDAATLITYLGLGNVMVPLDSVRVPHIPPRETRADGTRKKAIEKFSEEVDALFGRLDTDIEAHIDEMLSVNIQHAGNCFVGLAKYARIPQKWGGVIEEEIRSDFPNGSECTFFEIYRALCQCTSVAIDSGLNSNSSRITDMEEGICKVFNNRQSWTKFDLPGTVVWSNQSTKAGGPQ